MLLEGEQVGDLMQQGDQERVRVQVAIYGYAVIHSSVPVAIVSKNSLSCSRNGQMNPVFGQISFYCRIRIRRKKPGELVKMELFEGQGWGWWLVVFGCWLLVVGC